MKYIVSAGVLKCFLKSLSSILDLDDVLIAALSYNVFSLAKRFEAYESLGGIFDKVQDQATELTISLRICGFILDMVANNCRIYRW